jgi:hypothetical protein
MSGSGRYTAILDANVLYSSLLRDLLLSLAANRPDIADRIGLLLELVNASVSDCLVENYESLIGSLELPDPDDRQAAPEAIPATG